MNRGKIAQYFLMIFLPLPALLGMSAFILYTIQVRADRELLQNNELQNVGLQKKLISQQLQMVILDLMYLADQSHLQQVLKSINDRQTVAGLAGVFLSLKKCLLRKRLTGSSVRNPGNILSPKSSISFYIIKAILSKSDNL